VEFGFGRGLSPARRRRRKKKRYQTWPQGLDVKKGLTEGTQDKLTRNLDIFRKIRKAIKAIPFVEINRPTLSQL